MVVRWYERRSGGLFNALGKLDMKSVGVRSRVWHRRRGGEATHLFDRAHCHHCHTFPIHRGQRGQGVVDAGAGCSIVH